MYPAACWSCAPIRSRPLTTRASTGRARSSFTVRRASAPLLPASCSRTWVMKESSTSAASRTGPPPAGKWRRLDLQQRLVSWLSVMEFRDVLYPVEDVCLFCEIELCHLPGNTPLNRLRACIRNQEPQFAYARHAPQFAHP